MSLIKCRECGKKISSTAKVCPNCGVANDFKVCPDCGSICERGDKTCIKCGYPFTSLNTQNIINNNLDRLTGAQSKSYVTFKDLFKDTFSKHDDEELEDLFICGGKSTTPDVKDLKPENTKAWVYFRILMFFLIAYIPLRLGVFEYNNINFLPSMIILAAFAVPLTVLIFFFEINTFRNIPFYKVMKYFVLGGALSLILAILFYSLDFNTDITTYKGAFAVGIIEEVAKAVIVALFLFKSKKSKYILNGLLIGAAVGAGFAAFESAGYILTYGILGGLDKMVDVIRLRGVLTPGGHVVWAAIEGAALMYLNGVGRFNKDVLFNKRFYLILLIPIGLHSIWDMPIETSYYLLQVILSVVAWLVVIYFINLGLNQAINVKEGKVD